MKKYTILTSIISSLIICVIVVYFGRIYFPKNFQPETISFFENYWVLVLGVCFIVMLVSICILALLWSSKELVKNIKSLFN